MTPSGLGALAVLALVDSTSTGTLVIPVAMLIHEQPRCSRICAYLVAIGVFYWGLGMAISSAGIRALTSSVWQEALESRTAYAVQLALGIALVAGSYLVDSKAQERRRARRGDRPGLVQRMMASVLGPSARWGAVIGLALVAGGIEEASMLPYLAAIGILASQAPEPVVTAAILVAYVLVMVAPAIVLTALRMVVGERADALLERINAFIAKHSADSLAWVMGVLLALSAVSALWF